MSALTYLIGSAAPLLQANINTDIIAPLIRDASGMQPTGIRSEKELAGRLFGPWRYATDGTELPSFVLNRGAFRQARFLIAGPNFGCGSSRETAAAMLSAFGIRCVIAPSFGSIFQDNCFRNHMLPIVLEASEVDRLAALANGGGAFTLDLAAGRLMAPDASAVCFSVPAFRREMLLHGSDEVDVTLARTAEIVDYQRTARAARPWEWLASDNRS